MILTPARDPRNLILSAVAALIICCGSVVSFIVLAPSFPLITVESWEFGMNAAVAMRLVMGQDILFTFGPYAALYSTQYHPATDALMLGSGGLLAAAFAAGLFCLGRGKTQAAAAGFKLLALLFKLPPLYITYQFSNGTMQRYRYVAGMGATGFVIAPLVDSPSGFIALAQSPASLPFPVAFSLGPASATSWLWHATFHMLLSALVPPSS